jgi:hypothetical protein
MANTDDLIKDEEVMDAATNADASDVSSWCERKRKVCCNE